MIKSTIIPLTIVFLFACHSINKNPEDRIASNFKTLDTIVPFAGFWLNETYVKNIGRTKSPRECQNLMESCITIPARTLQPTSMISGFHEGSAEMVIAKKADQFQFYNKTGDTISNLAYNIQVITADKLKIGKNTYIKTNEHFLADILFSGNYQDSLNTNVLFSKDGHIKGLGAYTVYEPTYDYMGPGMEVDLIDLGQNPSNMDHFGYKFNQDTLFIYALNCLLKDSTDNTCLQVSFGDIKYKLIRMH